jgi:hypothetical protein
MTLAGRYNSLHGIERAKEVLTVPEFQLLLDELSALVLRYQLHDMIGLRLLHKHNDIYESEVMVEREEYDLHGHPCLSTVAVAATNTTNWEDHIVLLFGLYLESPFSHLSLPQIRVREGYPLASVTNF